MKRLKLQNVVGGCCLAIAFVIGMFSVRAFAQDAGSRGDVIKGKLATYFVDRLNGRPEFVAYLIEQGTQHRYELLGSKLQQEQPSSGRHITVRGTKKNSTQIAVTDLAYDDSTLAGATVSASLPGSSGEQKTLVYLVNFQDKPDEKPWTLAQIQDLVFNQVNSFFRENSANRTFLTGMTVGWYTIPLSSTTCDGFSIEGYSKAAAAAAGVVVADYVRHIFIFPTNSACGYSGMGQVGSTTSMSLINGSVGSIRTVAHELGHNLGLGHSHSIDCPVSPLDSPTSLCTTQEYGNTLDIMGYSGTVAHINSHQKDFLGWLAPSEIMTVSSGGTFNIGPLAFSTNTLRAIKIYRGVDAVSGKKQWLYIEYRQPIGFDSQIVDRGVIDINNVFAGPAVVLANEGGNGYLLDMTPGTNFVDMRDPSLLPGKVFTDAVSGVSIETLSATSSGVAIKISFASSGPNPPPEVDTTVPTVAFTSPSNGSSASGIVNVLATASDNVAIGKVEFYLDGVLKTSDATSPYGMSLDSKTITNGSHTLLAKAYDTSYNIATAQISIVVNNIVADTIAPIISITSPQNGAVFSPSSAILIEASASDNVGVSRVEFYVNGGLVCSDTISAYSCSYKLARTRAATYAIEARAFDSAGNMAIHRINISSSGKIGR